MVRKLEVSKTLRELAEMETTAEKGERWRRFYEGMPPVTVPRWPPQKSLIEDQ